MRDNESYSIAHAPYLRNAVCMAMIQTSRGPAQNTHIFRLIWSGDKKTRPRGYKTFFMLNSDEHEIFHANRFQNTNKIVADSFLLSVAEHAISSAN